MRRSILLGSRVAAVAMCVASSAVIAAPAPADPSGSDRHAGYLFTLERFGLHLSHDDAFAQEVAVCLVLNEPGETLGDVMTQIVRMHPTWIESTPNTWWVSPRRGTARTSCREEHTSRPFAARTKRWPPSSRLWAFVMATGGHEARERPEITKSLVNEWIGWSSPGVIRLVKDTLDLRSILHDFDIPTNPALIERLIRPTRDMRCSDDGTTDRRGQAIGQLDVRTAQPFGLRAS